MATHNNFWPIWRGRTLSAELALLVHTDASLASTLDHLGSVAALARRGQRVMLAAPARHADLLACAPGVWAVWPKADADDPTARPGALTATVGAQIELAALPELMDRADGEANRLAPRIHLPAPGLHDLHDAWAAAGHLRSERLLVGWCCSGTNPAPMPEIAAGDAITLAAWSRRAAADPVGPDLDLGPWPSDPAPDADPASAPGWLDCARQIALLDLLLTDDADAASLASALGKPVWRLDDTAPTAAALTSWAQAQNGTLHSALRNLPGADAQATMAELIAACQRGHTTAARAGCVQLLISQPQRPDAWRLLGLLAQHDGDPAQARALSERVTDIAPAYPDGWRSLALLCLQQGEHDAACRALVRYMTLAPHDSATRHQLAQLYRQAGLREQAIALYRAGLQHQPAELSCHLQLGMLLLDTDEPEAAAAHFNQVLGGVDGDDPRHAETLRLLGMALSAQGEADAAAACYRQALPGLPAQAGLDTRLALARLYQRRGRHDRAWSVLEPCLASHPDDALLQLEAAALRRALCDWSRTTDTTMLRAFVTAFLAQAERSTEPAAQPTAADSRQLSADALWHLCSQLDASSLAPLLRQRPAHPPARIASAGRTSRSASAPDRLRVAYAGSAAALQSHGALLTALREVHRQSNFKLHVYGWNAPPDAGPSCAHAFHDGDGALDEIDGIANLHGRSDSQIAARIHADQIDILIDLDGVSPHARSGIWMRHPAALQLAWLNQAGTQLPPGFDARLSDRQSDGARAVDPGPIEPPPSTSWLPDCHRSAVALPGLLRSSGRSAPTRAAQRAALGLPEKAPVLACLAPHASIDSATWSFWMRLLAACPPAVLWLESGLAASRKTLRQAAAAAGIAPQRLHFRAETTPSDHTSTLLALSQADVYLHTPDAAPCVDGSDRLIDALCAGVPTLCQAGDSHRACHSTALLLAAGLPEGLSTDAASHQAQAMRLLRHPLELLTLRQKLNSAHHHAPLFQPARLARKLEATWQEMWQHAAL